MTKLSIPDYKAHLDAMSDDERKKFYRKILGPVTRELGDGEIDELFTIIALAGIEAEWSNNQRIETAKYIVNGKRYDFIYYNGDCISAEEVLEDEENLR